MIFVVGALVVGALGLVVAWRHLADVTRDPSPPTRATLSKLRALEPSARARTAETLFARASWEGRLASAVTGTEDASERIDAASELVGDLATLYASRGRWAPVAVRVQLAAGLLFGALALVAEDRIAAAASVLVAVACAVVTHGLARSARARELSQRKLADELVTILLPEADFDASRRPARAGPPASRRVRSNLGTFRESRRP